MACNWAAPASSGATSSVSFDLDVYLGGGLGVGISTNGGTIGYNAHAVLGLELLFTRSISGFIEVRPLGFGNLGYYYGGAVGVNFRL